MSAWDQLNAWLAAGIVASLTWILGVVSPGLPLGETPTAHAEPGPFMIGWAQQADSPPIEQVGEGTGDDVETLDEGAPPAQAEVADNSETLDAGAPPAAQDEDIELLDQGAPPAAAGQPVETVYVAPAADTATTYVAPAPAPAAATGPVLPEGFGTGRVHAVAGRSEAPIGIADCHVGAVTGRAYVGIDCGEDDGNSFVGHAPSFEAFPFVLEAEFPFEGDEAFFTDPDFPFGGDDELAVAAARDDSAETGVFVSARGGGRERDDDALAAPAIETGGESSVTFAQRARNKDARVRVENRSRHEDSGKKRSRTDAESGRTSVESRDDDRRDDNDESNRLNAEDKEKKAKSKKDKKDRADRKEKKKRSRDRR